MHIVFAVQLFLPFFFLVLRQELIILMFSSFCFKGRVMFPLWFKNTTPLALVPQ